MHVATSFVSPVAARWPSIFAPTYTVLMCPPDASAHGARRKGTLPASPSPLPALLQSRYSNQPARARVIARYSNHSACIAPVDWGGLPPPHRPIPRTCARPHCNELDHPTADPTLEPLPPHSPLLPPSLPPPSLLSPSPPCASHRLPTQGNRTDRTRSEALPFSLLPRPAAYVRYTGSRDRNRSRFTSADRRCACARRFSTSLSHPPPPRFEHTRGAVTLRPRKSPGQSRPLVLLPGAASGG